jgi:D-alanyl-D-alanine carboxypeptidase
MSLRVVSKPFRLISLVFAFLASIALAPIASAEKYASIVVDANTTEVLHSRHADEARYPASLTKVMTLYLVFDALDSGELTLDEKLYVSRNAAKQPPSNLRLGVGTSIKLTDAIDALVNKSANDVAVVVAERLGGTERKFAEMMTEKARSLGMSNTNFRNASGLPDPLQISTARDLALLSQSLLNVHADQYTYFADREFRWGKRVYKNHNELLGKVRGVDGIKTGYTRASGFNLIASAERDGRRVIAVMLGGTTAKSRNQHVTDLLEAAFVSIGVVGTPEPDLRRELAFAQIKAPLHPDAAAEPMLNGKPLSAILGEGSAAAPDDDFSTEEGDEADAGEEDGMSVAEYEAQQLSH